MRDLHHILVPTDFSDHAAVALRAAVQLAKRAGAVLHLVHVIAPLPWPARRAAEARGVHDLAHEVRRSSEQLLDKVAKEVDPSVRRDLHILEGTPADEITKLVETLSADLVVVSTAGHTGLERLVLGSTAEKIVRTAPSPVLVVRDRPASWDKLSTILVPSDFGKLASLAIAEAVELARPHGAELVLTHVLAESDYPMGHVLKGYGLLDIQEQTRGGFRDHLEREQVAGIGDAVPSRVEVRDGVASTTIADMADEIGADVIVIASHGREGLTRFFLGSTAERVVRLAPCSVLVVKARGA